MSTGSKPWDASWLERVRANMFAPAHAAISDWERFPWHFGAPSLHSSQILAADVFGTIQTRGDQMRDAVLSAVAEKVGVSPEGPWRLELEWQDSKNLLAEKTPTQVDAVAFGANAIILFECKFTEGGGGCSQIKPDKHGAAACDGSYALQQNPRSKAFARCALTAKGIKYWDFIPAVYDLSAETDYAPCPFAFDAYQWMRNLALAYCLEQTTAKNAVVVAAYADAEHLQTAHKVRHGGLGLPPKDPNRAIKPLSYQALISIAKVAAPDPIWEALSDWVLRKIESTA